MNQIERKRLEELEAREQSLRLWQESERILKLLRTESGQPLKDFTEKEILTWYRQNNPC